MEYNLDNIQEFYDKMEESLNPKIRKMMVYAGYKRDEERRHKENEISKQFEIAGHAFHTHLISDDIAIVEEVRGANTLGYYAYVNGKRDYCLWNSFDEAVLASLAIKYTNSSNIAPYIWKMLK